MSSTLQDGINHIYSIAKRRGNRSAEKHSSPWPEGQAAAGRGLGSPPTPSTDLFSVPFGEVPVLSAPRTKALGQDRLAQHMYSAEHATISPSGELRGGHCDSSKAGRRKRNVICLWQDQRCHIGQETSLKKFPVALDV